MNLSDKDLDRLFREAGDRFEPDDSMLSWERLEQNLAGQLPERPPGSPRRFGFRPLVWIPAAVVFAGLSLFLIKNHVQYRSISTLPSTNRSAAVSSEPRTGDSPSLTPEETPGENASPTTPYGAEATASGKGKPPREAEAQSAADASGAAPVTSGPHAGRAVEETGAPDSASSATSRKSSAASHAPGTGSTPGTETTDAAKNTTGTKGNNPGSGGTGLTSSARTTGSVLKTRAPGKKLTATGTSPSGAYPLPDNVTALTVTRKRSFGKNNRLAVYANGISDKERNNIGNKSGNNGREINEQGNGSNGETNNGSNGEKNNGFNEKDEVSGTGISSPEFAQTHLPEIIHTPIPAIRTKDDALKTSAANEKSLPLPGRSVQVRQPFTVGLVMGPDYSDGGIASSQLGNSVGISFSYYLTDRVSLNSGLLYGVKSYAARGKAFEEPPRNYLEPYGMMRHVQQVNGTVNLFEIPLSLRYDFPVSSKTRFFLNAGISSYLPVRERFTTYFTLGRDQNDLYAETHRRNAPESHWFGIGHFSGGIERELGKGLSFQVEPYFNLPFTNVCEGNVKLNTYGLLFSIRFTPVISRHKR